MNIEDMDLDDLIELETELASEGGPEAEMALEDIREAIEAQEG